MGGKGNKKDSVIPTYQSFMVDAHFIPSALHFCLGGCYGDNWLCTQELPQKLFSLCFLPLVVVVVVGSLLEFCWNWLYYPTVQENLGQGASATSDQRDRDKYLWIKTLL